MFLLYGATGYSGELIARRSVAAGLRPTVAGRNGAAVARLAEELGVAYAVVAVDDAAGLDAAIGDHAVVLNCAGPFSRTARQVADACLRRHAHYLDITGEMAVFESMAARDGDARRAGVMLLPGVGFDVVPSDCLAAHVARQLPSATRLTLAIAARESGGVSRGTALTMIEGLAAGKGSGAVRRNGRITQVPPAWKTRLVDFGDGSDAVRVVTMPWGDVSTAFHSTGIPNVEVYMAIPGAARLVMRHGRWLLPLLASAPVRRWLTARVERGRAGPSAAQRGRGRSLFWAEAADDAGRTAAARLVAPEGYELTVRAAVACVRLALGGHAPVGFQTPSRAYGADLVLTLDDVRREDDPPRVPRSA